ncbi:MAG: thioredoxin domain-containing protein [Terriglobales bacterium]
MKQFTLCAFIIAFTTALTLSSAAQQNKNNNSAVAQIGGKTLTAADFENKEAGDLLQARYKMYESERKVLDKYIDDQLLKQQADKAGLTVDQLLESQVYKGIKDPTDDQMEVFYEGLSNQEQPFSAVRDKILDHIREVRRVKARDAYLKSLREHSHIQVLLAPPTADVDVQGGNVRGPKDAPVTLVEFADYECPYCSKVDPVLQTMEKEYGNRLKVVFKDFPLPMHKDAEKAAEGAHCAGDQGKFWEYHDLLFSSHQVDVPSLKAHAAELKLNQAKFDACLDSGAEAAAVKKDQAEGTRLGLTGTPSFFVNGHFFSGAADSAMLHEMIGMEMPASSSAGASTTVPPTAIAQSGK